VSASPRPPAAAPAGRALRAVVAAALPLALGACDWFTDFKNQPKLEPWEPTSQEDNDTTHAPRGNPQFSVPVSGTFVAGYQVSYTPLPGTVDSMSALPNPTPPSPASLANGRKHYQINCTVCHGDTGAGNGPNTRHGMPAISIISDLTKGRSDGYLYGMLRNGRGLMPTYNRIEEMDRWDVVNYVRALQGRIPNSAGIGPVGYPGQNGATVPGYSATAPTRVAPHWRDARGPLGSARPGGNAPAPAGEVRTPAEALGQVRAPVPAGANDSGPQARLNPNAPAAPAPDVNPTTRPPRGGANPGARP
jgi:mono/diheme cytochrome c family protein